MARFALPSRPDTITQWRPGESAGHESFCSANGIAQRSREQVSFNRAKSNAPGPSRASMMRQYNRLRRCSLAACCELAALAPLALSLSGCLATQIPDVRLVPPPAYREGGGNPNAALPPLEWWKGFRSAEFNRLMAETQAANLDIAAAVARILQADAQARISGAPLLPLVGFDASASKQQFSRTSGSSGGGLGGSRVSTTYNTTFNASYEIDFWGKNRAAYTTAQNAAIASRFARDVVALTTLSSTANAYLEVLVSQDRLRIAHENLTSSTRILNLIRQRFQAGTAAALDTAQQETLVATVRASIPPLEQTVRQNIAILAVLVGRPPEALMVRGGSLDRLAIPRVSPGLPADLLLLRPDIREAESQLTAASFNVTAVRAAMFPSIQLTGSGGFQSAALQTLFSPQSSIYSAAASLTQPVFDGFRLQNQVALARAQQDELLLTYRKTIISAFADVDSALVAVRKGAERERLQREAVISSKRAFKLTDDKLREGTVDMVTVLTVQQTLFQNEDLLAQARLARFQAAVSLYQALGGGWLLPTKGRPHAG
jgi:NodT family efflux transporter outer membrane factor (OMF) lipoprotein